MPWVPPNSSFPFFPNGSGYYPKDYRAVIAALAASYGFSFVDQSGLQSLTDTNFTFKDQIHESSPFYYPGGPGTVGGGAQAIGNLFNQSLGL